ncbi:hypothetical protein FRC12_001800 [Ceratobasidium sp. 428]|nr:hypothetical protein FRC12_001800 [Ceratobasidium sp. 428]
MPNSTPSQGNNRGSEPALTTKRYPELYLEDSLVTIQVGDMTFEVDKDLLVKSKIFSNMLETADDDPDEGTSPREPIVLEGVAASDFEHFLGVLKTHYYSRYQPKPNPSSVIPAFRLARKFRFKDISAYLLPFADKILNEVNKIVLGRECGIQEWVISGHTVLAQWFRPFTPEEEESLGKDSVKFILQLRRKFRSLRKRGGLVPCGWCTAVPHQTRTGRCFPCDRIASFDGPKAEILRSDVKAWLANGCVLPK